MEAVREAVVGDAARFAELERELVEQVVTQRGGALVVDPDRRGTGAEPMVPLAELLAAEQCLVLVGTLDDVVIGYLQAHLDERGAHGRRGVLDACYVEPAARGVGVGRLLLDRAMAWFRDQGCGGVDGIALPGDRDAKAFFEGAGFKARLLTMHHPLE
jgi:GNAT superfamily N-acetyltransferase